MSTIEISGYGAVQSIAESEMVRTYIKGATRFVIKEQVIGGDALSLPAVFNCDRHGDVIIFPVDGWGKIGKSTDGGLTYSGVSNVGGVGQSCCYDSVNGAWIVCANANSANIYRSTDDGANWSTAISTTDASGTVCSVGGYTLSFSNLGSTTIRVSGNGGSTWGPQVFLPGQGMYAKVANGAIVVWGTNNTTIYRSTSADLSTWATFTLPSAATGNMKYLAYGNSTYVVMTTTGEFWQSYDLVGWLRGSVTLPATHTSLVFDGKLKMFIANSTQPVMYVGKDAVSLEKLIVTTNWYSAYDTNGGPTVMNGSGTANSYWLPQMLQNVQVTE